MMAELLGFAPAYMGRRSWCRRSRFSRGMRCPGLEGADGTKAVLLGCAAASAGMPDIAHAVRANTARAAARWRRSIVIGSAPVGVDGPRYGEPSPNAKLNRLAGSGAAMVTTHSMVGRETAP